MYFFLPTYPVRKLNTEVPTKFQELSFSGFIFLDYIFIFRNILQIVLFLLL